VQEAEVHPGDSKKDFCAARAIASTTAGQRCERKSRRAPAA
jgi:hypothetical protein